jgi:hypothetical protein
MMEMGVRVEWESLGAGGADERSGGEGAGDEQGADGLAGERRSGGHCRNSQFGGHLIGLASMGRRDCAKGSKLF